MISFRGKLSLLLFFLSLNDVFCMKNVKAVTLLSAKEPFKAIDGDVYTFAQSKDMGPNISLSILLDHMMTFSCFNMKVRGGNYDIYISQNDATVGGLCRSFYIKDLKDLLRSYTILFCCHKEMDGKKITIMKMDNGPLRLFEIDMSDWSEHQQNLLNCSKCDEHCNVCLKEGKQCTSCLDDYRCSEQCRAGECRMDGTCSKCNAGYYGSQCEPCETGKYGENCEQVCKPGCKSNCDNIRGICKGCERGYFGPPKCDKLCNVTLNDCQSCNNASLCENCQTGRYGSTCSKKCPDHCDFCINSTFCTHCKAGYFGILCNSKCHKNCLFCSNESYCDTCRTGWVEPQCQCSIHCDGECSDKGECFGNCSDGWYGSNCQQECSSHCKQCKESASKCTECYHGYPPQCSNEKLYVSEEAMTMMMAGGGGILVLVLITICIIIIIRKLCSSNQGDAYGFIENQDIELEPISQTNPYSDLDSAQYINDSHRMAVDEFILNVHHKKQNYAFRREFKKISYSMNETYYAAIDPKNKSRNRYKKVYPYDFSRVILDTSDSPGSSDYINACFVHGFRKQRAYIAAQGPFTEETVLDFWRMVWQMRSVKIVMLTNLTEEGKMKCLKYWPNAEASIGPFLIKTERQSTCRRYIIRHIKLKMGIEEKVVTHYQYTAWYTIRVPTNVDSLLLFRNIIMSDVSDDDGPIIVHCSAGVGRTGTFIALDYLLDEGIATGSLDVVGYIQTLRQQRAYAVQSTDEYIFLHDALVEGLTSAHENRSIEIAEEL